MKKVVFAMVFSLLSFAAVNAQQIEMKKVFGGYTFSQNDKILTTTQLQEIMQDNKEALELIKSAKKNQTWGMVLGAAGGALVGYPIGTAIGGGDPNWALAGAGAALIVATIPIVKSFNKKAKKAVELYNANQPTVSANFTPEFNVNFKGMSMGLSMTF